MQRLGVLDVGDGLCIAIGEPDEMFVFDCGEHRKRGGVPFSWKKLVARTTPDSEIATVAVSHLHADHYCGLLKPLPNIRRDVTFVIGRLPKIRSDPPLREKLALWLLVIASLDPRHGPLDIDLLRRVKEYAPDLTPLPVSSGEQFPAAGENWTVLWPPEWLEWSERRHRRIQRAIGAYEDAAREDPMLDRRLKQIRGSDTYSAMLDELSDSVESEPRLCDDETSEEDESVEG